MPAHPKTACDSTSRRLSIGFLDLAARAVVFVLAVAALASLAGCDSQAVGIQVVDARREPLALGDTGLPAPVEDACDFWGIECEAAMGPVVLYLQPNANADALHTPGSYLGGRSCFRALVAVDAVVRHELGHAIGGLGDVEHDPINVMNASEGGPVDEATDDQRDAVAEGAAKLARCP